MNSSTTSLLSTSPPPSVSISSSPSRSALQFGRKFEPSAGLLRHEKMWTLPADFGVERKATHFLLNEVVSDRYALVNGLQLLRDELQLASTATTDMAACGADFSLPSVLTTLAKTNCGDRIHQGETTFLYHRVVAGRFATMSEMGDLKLESFSPTGGGTDDGKTLAHVTIAHQIDDTIRKQLYNGNAQSFVLAGIDLQTHVGKSDEGGIISFGRTRESPFREPRAACGAIVGLLSSFKETNAVHRRLKDDLGKENFEFLSKTGVKTEEGIDITFVVAAAIIAIQGLKNTLFALGNEMDERGMGHITASITVNRPGRDDTIIYLARGTSFYGHIRFQGLGVDAKKYGGRIIERHSEKRLCMFYDGLEPEAHPMEELSTFQPHVGVIVPENTVEI